MNTNGIMSDREQSSAAIRRTLNLSRSGRGLDRDQLVAHAARRLHILTKNMLRNYSRLRRWEATDDVFQSAMMRLFASLGEVVPTSERQFFGLAATQIRRTLIDLSRRYFGPEGMARHHESDDGSVPYLNQSPCHSSQPDTLAEWTRFHETVEQLPNEDRESFSLIWYGGLTQVESARVLGISQRTMTRRITRARLQLHKVVVGGCFASEEQRHGE